MIHFMPVRQLIKLQKKCWGCCLHTIHPKGWLVAGLSKPKLIWGKKIRLPTRLVVDELHPTNHYTAPPGTVYIYSIHGRYLLDVAAQEKDVPQGALIRAVEPTIGQKIMLANRKKHGFDLTNGPEKLMEAFGIADKEMNFEIFGNHSKLAIDQQRKKAPAQIETSNRIGVANQGDWATRPLRYFVKGNPYVSGIKKRDVDQENFGWTLPAMKD